MLDKELEYTLNMAFKEARTKRHEFVTVEHFLLHLLDNTSALDVLKACGANISRLRSNLTEFIDRTTPIIPLIFTTEIRSHIGFSACDSTCGFSSAIIRKNRSGRCKYFSCYF